MQRRMRYLRQKYNIPIQVLSKHSDVSAQRLSQLELGDSPGTAHMNRLAETAFRRYILQKSEELARLDADLTRYCQCLIEHVNENGESL